MFKAAKETNTALEINSYTGRLDLDDTAVLLAKDAGVMLGIATDTHTKGQFSNMIFGVSVARRGWLERKNVINALPFESFIKRIMK
ncbi:MAG: hypothetical protein ABID09_07670 [Candidatus Omnitrophota bacterium]